MSKPRQGNNKPAAAQPAADATPKDPALDAGTDKNLSNENEGGGVKDEALDPTLVDQNTDSGEPKQFFTLPADVNEGIDAVVAQLRSHYEGVDVDKILADRFVPGLEDQPEEAAPARDVVIVGSYELVFPLKELAENITESGLRVRAALANRQPVGDFEFPVALVGVQFSDDILDRYIRGVLYMGNQLEEAELVFADPAVDPHLRTLNFQRMLQGLAVTHFYVRFL